MDTRVPFFDLRVVDPALRSELLSAVEGVLTHGRILFGPEVDAFESRVAEETGTNYAVAVASGSSALYLSLRCLDIGPGDEVITTPLTWIITAHAILECGATPVFADIRDDFTLDPVAVEKAITPKTKAILPVHFTGLMCNMDAICAIADKHDLHIIEDAAQAYGAEYRSRRAGSFSAAGAFSMNSMKVLGGYGEMGAVVTDHEELMDKVKILRYSGTKSDPTKIVTNEAIFCSLNHKPDTIQAAMLLPMMDRLPERMQRRSEIARRYNKALGDLVKTPALDENGVHALYTYAVLAENRDELMKSLNEAGVETKIYHTPLVPDAPVYQDYRMGDTENAKKILSKFLSIPAHEKLTDDQVDYVIAAVRDFYR